MFFNQNFLRKSRKLKFFDNMMISKIIFAPTLVMGLAPCLVSCEQRMSLPIYPRSFPNEWGRWVSDL